VTMARMNGEIRSAWIVEPGDGRLPYNDAGRTRLAPDPRAFDGPEGRPPQERCLSGLGGVSGPPMLNAVYNANYQIVQTPDRLVIVAEMNHDARVIRLDDRRHAPPQVRAWMGDSVGWWEGTTLVVETTNFTPAQSMRRRSLYISPEARIVERFTRTSPGEILYQFSVEDPANYTQTWRAEMPLRTSHGPVYEYACHEGNYSMPNILAGARQIERDSKSAAAR
jgi:hypothetical protein